MATEVNNYIEASRPKAYLIIYEHRKAGGLLRNELRISGDCYPISLPQLDVPQANVKCDEYIDVAVIPHAVKDGYDIIANRRAKVAHELIRGCSVDPRPQDCVLIPRERWDTVNKELELRRKFAGRWKRLAKELANLLREIA